MQNQTNFLQSFIAEFAKASALLQLWLDESRSYLQVLGSPRLLRLIRMIKAKLAAIRPPVRNQNHAISCSNICFPNSARASYAP